jgi:hypothetical protein
MVSRVIYESKSVVDQKVFAIYLHRFIVIVEKILLYQRNGLKFRSSEDKLIESSNSLLALASTAILGFGTQDVIHVRPKTVCVFGNGVSSLKRGRVCVSEQAPVM